MSDRDRPAGRPPHEGSPEWDWLYGPTPADPAGPATPAVGAPGEPGRPTDPEPTRMMPTAGAASTAGPSPAPGPVPDQLRPAQLGPDQLGPAQLRADPLRADQLRASPRRPRRLLRFGWLKLLVLAWLAFMIAVPLWAWSAIDKVGFEPGGDRPAEQPGTTYLLVGSDSRAGLTRAERRELGTGDAEGRRTDTIMLLHVGDGPNLLVSIPRDSQVEIPGRGTSKINAAYAWGGPKLLVRTLEQNTGIRIDEYVEIGMGGVVSVVDAVGGIEICPPARMKDPLANLDVKKGCQQADGATALAYARSRHTSGLGDIDRAAHQREVVAAVGKKAASPWSVLNPVRYVGLARAGSDSLRIGKSTGPLALGKFAWAMTRVTGTSGMTCGVPIADLSVRWDPDRSAELFTHIINDDTAGIPQQLCTPSGMPR